MTRDPARPDPQDSPDPRRFFSIEQDLAKHGGHLPHWQQGAVWCFVIWRLADSLPRAFHEEWEAQRQHWLHHHPLPWEDEVEREYHRRFSVALEQWLDQGCGECLLRRPEFAAAVGRALRHFDGSRYQLHDFVVMPNHVHVLLRAEAKQAIQDLVRSWKGVSAREINRLRGASGVIWQRGYWDRLIRTPQHLEKTSLYIRNNPEKAGLRQGEYLLSR